MVCNSKNDCPLGARGVPTLTGPRAPALCETGLDPAALSPCQATKTPRYLSKPLRPMA